MDYLAMFIFGAAASGIGCAAWCAVAYQAVIARFTTEGEGVHIIMFGERRVAMVALD